MSKQNTSSVKLSELVKAVSGKIAWGGPRKADEIIQIEETFMVNLPSDFRQFLGNYGFIRGTELTIWGIPQPEDDMPSLGDMILALRLGNFDMPTNVIPIEAIDEYRFACIQTIQDRSMQAKVVLFDANAPESSDRLIELAPTFHDYLYNRLVFLLTESQTEGQGGSAELALNYADIDTALAVFEQHVHDYNQRNSYDHAKGGKLPRNHDWRPYRYCIQDVVFGIIVVRHNRELNCLEVDVFLTAQIPQYDELAGANALTSFLLSEAYRCGGTMEIHFTRNIEQGTIPSELQALAQRHNISFVQEKHGRILPAEAKALYAALTDFSPKLHARLHALEDIGKLRVARACYVIHHGLWSKEQVELIALGSQRPDSILAGAALPSDRHLYRHDLLHARSAVMVGMLERVLLQRNRRTEDGVDYDLEDDIRPLQIAFNAQMYAKCYSAPEDIPLPWLYGTEGEHTTTADLPFVVLVRARDVGDLKMHLLQDIEYATAFSLDAKQPSFILIPRDYHDLPMETQRSIFTRASESGIGILICPESTLTLDQDAAARLARSRVLRQ